MSLCEVYYINVVADTSAIRSIVVVTEDSKLLAYADSCLCYERNEVVRHAVRQLADFCRRVSTNRVEVSKNDALDRGTAVDIVGNNLLVDFLCIAIRRCRLLVRSILCNGEVFWLRLTIYSAA